MHEWYMIPVRFEIIKISKRHEFAFLKPSNIRALNLWNIDQFEKYFEVANYDTKRPNMYMSVSGLRNIPIFTYHPAKRQKETSVWFREGYFNEVFSYDLFMDFDKEKDEPWEDLIKEVKGFIEYLTEYKVPYELVFSGNKGFQIIIPYEYLPADLTFEVDDVGKGKKGSVYEYTKVFQEKAKEVFGLDHLDLANNGVPNRLRKLPYTLVGENVALPLNDAQFNNFRIEEMDWRRVKQMVRIKDRGMLLRDHGLSEKKLKEGFLIFVKEFGLK